MNGHEIRNAFVVEYWAIICLIFPLTAGILILGLQVTGWRSSEDFAETIVRDNWVVVVLVQLVSQTLGMILVSALCAIVKIHLETSVSRGSVSVENVRFLNALSQTRPILSKRIVFTVIAVLAAILATVPGALWAGAISPHLDTNILDRVVQIPYYNSSFVERYRTQLGASDSSITSTLIQNDKGVFADDPNQYDDSLLTSAQRASNQEKLHPKLDNTGYTFVGRSYGTGSLIGFEPVNDTKRPLAYTYHETGIVADVHCYRNASSTFGIVETNYGDDTAGWPGTLGQTEGFWPNGSPVPGMWLFGSILGDLFAIGAPNIYGDRHADIVVASAGTSVNRLATASYNQTQCEVTFSSHKIRLDVNVTAQTITTTKLEEVPWPHYGDLMVNIGLFGPTSLSVTDNGYGGSRVERAMRLNTEVLFYDKHGEFPGYNVATSLLYQSIADFMADVIDNTMVATGACQSQCFDSVQHTTATVVVPSVVWGHEIFVYGMLSLSVLVALICVGYITLRRAWSEVVQIDFSDPSNVALNASKGGAALFYDYEAQDRFRAISITLADPSSRWPGIVRASSEDEEREEDTASQKSKASSKSSSESLPEGS